MKIRVTISLDLTEDDIEAWCTEYSIDRNELREDVKGAIVNLVQSQYAGLLGIEGITGR